MKAIFKAALAMILMGAPAMLMAQAQRSQEFKDKYQLKEAVVLSRHNIRSPDRKSVV